MQRLLLEFFGITLFVISCAVFWVGCLFADPIAIVLGVLGTGATMLASHYLENLGDL